MEYFKALAEESEIPYQTLIIPLSAGLRRARAPVGPALAVLKKKIFFFFFFFFFFSKAGAA